MGIIITSVVHCAFLASRKEYLLGISQKYVITTNRWLKKKTLLLSSLYTDKKD